MKKLLTVDLEKKMISSKILTIDEEIGLEMVKNHLGDLQVSEREVLNRIGMNNVFEISSEAESKLARYHSLDSKRIFDKEEIIKLCMKYDLRFLGSDYYKGSIDPLLATKVLEFESKTGIKIAGPHSCSIAAPKNAFKLEKRPVDPLYFYYLGDNKYYLIHKWGKDISIFRRIRGFFGPLISMGPFFFVSQVVTLMLSTIFTTGVFDMLTKSVQELDSETISFIDFSPVFVLSLIGFNLILNLIMRSSYKTDVTSIYM